MGATSTVVPGLAVDGSSTRHVSAMDVGAAKRSHDSEELPIETVISKQGDR